MASVRAATWIRVGLASLALVLSGVAITGIIQQVDREAERRADAAFSAATTSREASIRALTTATRALVAARETAVETYRQAQEVAAAVDGAVLADPGTLSALADERDALRAAASLTVDADGAVRARPVPLPDATADVASMPADRDGRVAAAAATEARAARNFAAAAKREAQAKTTSNADERVTAAVAAVVASAFMHGSATPAPDRAPPAEQEAYRAAVTALGAATPTSDVVTLLAAYRAAWQAALAAHEAVIAAEEAAAARPASCEDVEPTYVQGVLVVNKSYPLPCWYGDGLTGDTVAAFEAMAAEAAASGFGLYISSGFRSYWDQEWIYNNFAARDGAAAADRYSARPGHSEHQSGLTFDLNCICEAFGYQADGLWVAANAHRFGFIVRYPQGKEHITGYVWEPWHMRHVGIDVATAVFSSGLTLEEYLGVSSTYSY